MRYKQSTLIRPGVQVVWNTCQYFLFQGNRCDTFVTARFAKTHLDENSPGDGSFALQIDQKFIRYIQDFVYASRVADRTSQDFLRRIHGLRPGDYIPLTFSAKVAYERKLIEFLTIRHPIVRAAIAYWQGEPSEDLPIAQVLLKAEPRLVGDYYFFVFAFKAEALEHSTSLATVAVSTESHQISLELCSRFLRLVQQTSIDSGNTQQQIDIDYDQFVSAQKVATEASASERDRRETDLARSNDALINARLAAIEQTYRIKKQTVERYLQSDGEVRIRRMHEAQLRNIEAKRNLQVSKLESQRHVAVSFSLVLAGLANVR